MGGVQKKKDNLADGVPGDTLKGRRFREAGRAHQDPEGTRKKKEVVSFEPVGSVHETGSTMEKKKVWVVDDGGERGSFAASLWE